MSLSTDRHIRNLPKRLPAGTVYVVEGRGGHHGNLRVSSRYVVMPDGQKLNMPAELGRKQLRAFSAKVDAGFPKKMRPDR